MSEAIQEKPVELVSMQLYGTWGLKIEETVCLFCRGLLLEHCPNCVEDKDTGGTKVCDQTTGKCGHTFHSHCVAKWLQDKQHCIHCNNQWTPQDNNLTSTDTMGKKKVKGRRS